MTDTKKAEAKPSENKMGTMPVGKLLITMSLPMIASMMVQALYNVVDSIFVARVSKDALDAVGAAFPVQNILIGVGTGTAVGVNALLSKSLGQKEYDRANRIAENGIFLAFCASVAFLLFGLFGVDLYMQSCNVSDGVRTLGTDYLQIVCVCSFGVLFQVMFERLLQSTGRTLFTMFTQGIGAIINLILDPIFIFGYLGLPAMGVKGAAYATVIGQIVAAILAVVFNVFKNPDIRLKLSRFRPNVKIIGRIYAIGVPSILMVGIGSIMTYCMQRILSGMKDTAGMGYTVYNVYFKLQSFFFMPLFGMNNGVIPIVAYNYGARNRKRMMATLKLAMIMAFCFMAAGFTTMQVFPKELLSIFKPENCDLELFYDVGSTALRIICIHLPLAGFCIAIGSIFQALGRSIFSMTVSAARQLVVLIPAAFLLSLTGKVSSVWWAFPIAEVMSLAVSVSLFVYLYRKEIKHIPDGLPVK
ncbi:MAG: MATE family efflux transporter [Clostridia bacterium]|nr:MATE family efflux transporter [Clostridia bacterium]